MSSLAVTSNLPTPLLGVPSDTKRKTSLHYCIKLHSELPLYFANLNLMSPVPLSLFTIMDLDSKNRNLLFEVSDIRNVKFLLPLRGFMIGLDIDSEPQIMEFVSL